MSLYYLQKEGIYPQGVFWIGESKQQGIIEADLFAANDEDSYHSWDLYEYNYNSTHIESPIYSTRKPKNKGCGL